MQHHSKYAPSPIPKFPRRLVVPLVAFAVIGLLCSAYLLRLWSHGQASLTWPSTPGTVTLVKGIGRMNIRIQANYSVNGVEYQNHWRGYTLKEEMPVYYDPLNPANSVLEPGVNGQHFMFTAAGAALCFFAVIAMGLLLAFPQWESND